MTNQDIELMAHLMRRAGFGASYQELERRAAQGYEATVEELLHPEDQPELKMDVMKRYMGWRDLGYLAGNQGYWTYRMVNSPRQLEEKLTLFWHSIFCTGDSKCMAPHNILAQLNKFRAHGFGSFEKLLLDLSTDPAMLYYLDNPLSHKEAVNENWGRELLELFTMGVGMDGQPNYTEADVQACAQAFTGWTIANGLPRYPYGRYYNEFLYNQFDHIEDDKTFLGETGNFNGQDIINIIAKQPATARFVSRHLYDFFVADEPPVPVWQHTPPQDPELIQALEEEYFRSGYEIRSMLRALFNSDSFKNARFAKVKSPAELVCGTMRLVGDFATPRPRIYDYALEIRYMGQDQLGRYYNEFLYNQFDHIDDDKTFLGETGNFNGQDIIQIIAKQPATARFVSRHLYDFFVADEPPVPVWQHTPPQDPELIQALEEEYFRSGYEIRSMLRALFNSDSFKNARFAKVKSPAELVCGTMRLVGDFATPRPRIYDYALEIRYMGQDLMNPPTVEGWHTGREWIDSGTLVERINFAAGEMGSTDASGIRSIIDRLVSEGPTLSAERLVNGCLELIGNYELLADTHTMLMTHAQEGGPLQTDAPEFAQRVGQMLQLIVSTQEYQFT